jgi:hypothetical protein
MSAPALQLKEGKLSGREAPLESTDVQKAITVGKALQLGLLAARSQGYVAPDGKPKIWKASYKGANPQKVVGNLKTLMATYGAPEEADLDEAEIEQLLGVEAGTTQTDFLEQEVGGLAKNTGRYLKEERAKQALSGRSLEIGERIKNLDRGRQKTAGDLLAEKERIGAGFMTQRAKAKSDVAKQLGEAVNKTRKKESK